MLVGAVLSSLIGWLGYRRHALNRSGMVGAVLIGTTVVGFSGLVGGTLLVFFFVSSSILSSFKAQRKSDFAEKFSKGSQRDLGQSLANGGVAALAAAMYALAQADWARAALVGALATATADTWATELGVLSKVRPRLISTGAPVGRGTSGGITFAGTLATAAGAISIAGLAALLQFGDRAAILFIIGTISGMIGAIFDSLLGATVQAMYRCNACAKDTEHHPRHSCGTYTHQIRGWSWLNNDVVNFLATALGALIAGTSISLST